jgi:microsomal dipeptidase-like Zn-dependent dipeptidase
MTAQLLIDSHLDLALNALEWNRDLTRPIAEIRAAEAGLPEMLLARGYSAEDAANFAHGNFLRFLRRVLR